MTRMTRRGFLGALAAAGATVAAKPAFAAAEYIDGRFTLIGRELVLDKPLVLKGLNGFFIRDCIISASENFVGNALVHIANRQGGLITECRFDVRNVKHNRDFIAAILYEVKA